MNYNFLLINIYIKSTLRFGLDLKQLAETLGVEWGTDMSFAEISDEMLAVWLAAHYPSFTSVRPVQANLVVQENRYILAMQDLQKAQAELDDKQRELDVVQTEYEQAMTEKQVTVPWHGRDCHTPTWLL